MDLNLFTAVFSKASARIGVVILITTLTSAQEKTSFADNIRIKYKIPELAYAVISSDSVLEMQIRGTPRIKSNFKASITDKFRIGSNTKAITGFIAAQLVKQGEIKWDTKFFDLFPELKSTSKEAYHQLTLLNLLSFRTRLFSYTYTYAEPGESAFKGNEEEQRYQFTKWFFGQEPVSGEEDFHFSNLGYTAAGLMLEKVSGKTYKQLVNDLGKQLNIEFGFGAPNVNDSLQPWGHNADLIPEAPAVSFKLNWLLAAGNINISLPDYLKFIQLQLQGLKGESKLLTKEEFEFLHFGLQRFAVGWFWQRDEKGKKYSYNVGNPGTFLSKVCVFPESDKAIIILTNAQTNDSDTGTNELYEELKKKFTGK